MAVMPAIDAINANLRELADGKRVRYLNVNDKLADKDGKLFDGMMKPTGCIRRSATRSGPMR